MSDLPDPTAKRAALEEVLRSGLFLRSEQLRSFLRYICEIEMAGRGAELNEYLIGVEALGKQPGYSTAEDATVRRRAHDLREMLDEVYANELAGASFRIELPKGRYVPRYVPSTQAATGPEEAMTAAAWNPATSDRGRPRWAVAAASFVAGSLLAGIALAPLRAARPTADPILADAWGPFARPGASLMLSVAAPAHFNVLPYPEGPMPLGVRLVPDQWNIGDWYQKYYPTKPGYRLGMHVATGPLRSGEVLGLVTAVQTLTQWGVDFQVVVDKRLSLGAVRGRNLLLFANPEYSEVAAALLERAVWTVDYDPASRTRVVRPQKSDGAHRTYVPGPDWQRRSTFGLLTVLSNDADVVAKGGTASGSKVVVVSCTNSPGCQAAMEFFASPGSMRALRERFRAESQPGFPQGYQVVVRCQVHRTHAVSGEYESHAVLP